MIEMKDFEITLKDKKHAIELVKQAYGIEDIPDFCMNCGVFLSIDFNPNKYMSDKQTRFLFLVKKDNFDANFYDEKIHDKNFKDVLKHENDFNYIKKHYIILCNNCYFTYNNEHYSHSRKFKIRRKINSIKNKLKNATINKVKY